MRCEFCGLITYSNSAFYINLQLYIHVHEAFLSFQRSSSDNILQNKSFMLVAEPKAELWHKQLEGPLSHDGVFGI